MDHVLLANRQANRPATLAEYRASGGYQALARALRELAPKQVLQLVQEAGLRGRGGAGFPAGRKWAAVPDNAPHPRYLLANSDEMEPGTFKDRVLVNVDPQQVIEGIILAAYAVSASRGIFFVRPSYEQDALLIERELLVAREAGFIGGNILGSGFSFELTVHRSGGRYICGEATAQLNAIQGRRPNPIKVGPYMTEKGLWGLPTVLNNVETLACVPHIIRQGPTWFRGLARTEGGSGTKLYCVSGRVARPGCYELPIGTPLIEIIDGPAGGMAPGSQFKACLPGGASTSFMPARFLNVEMDFEATQQAGFRLGTGGIVVFDQRTCLVAATLNLMEYFSRESCGWCTPCREGLPFIRELLRCIEYGEGRQEHVEAIRQMARAMDHSYCAFAPGAVQPVLGLLEHFSDEVQEHISQKKCPFASESVADPLDIWRSRNRGAPGTKPQKEAAACPR